MKPNQTWNLGFFYFFPFFLAQSLSGVGYWFDPPFVLSLNFPLSHQCARLSGMLEKVGEDPHN